MAQSRPQLVSPRRAQTLDAVRQATGNGSFDPDAWVVMDARDSALIADEVLHGPGSNSFVYRFKISGQEIVGISVIGARMLAHYYRGLKHRIVASMEKIGPLFTFVSYPGEHQAMSVSCNVVPELESEPDFYSAVVEIVDIKTGNSIQMEKREARVEYRRDGSTYERQHYSVIAQSKAYRNCILALIPQDVVIRWRDEMLKLGKDETITTGVLAEKRSSILRFATRHALALDRRTLEQLGMDEIAGLSDAAREGLPAFINAAQALRLETATEPADDRPVDEAGRKPSGTPTSSGAAPDNEKREENPSPSRQPSGESSTGSPPGSPEGEPSNTRRGRRVNFD